MLDMVRVIVVVEADVPDDVDEKVVVTDVTVSEVKVCDDVDEIEVAVADVTVFEVVVPVLEVNVDGSSVVVVTQMPRSLSSGHLVVCVALHRSLELSQPQAAIKHVRLSLANTRQPTYGYRHQFEHLISRHVSGSLYPSMHRFFSSSLSDVNCGFR